MTSRLIPSSRALIAALVVGLAALLVLGGGTSKSAFVVKITNPANSLKIGYNVYGSCRAADLADQPLRLYSLADSATGAQNLSTSGDGVAAQYVLSLISLSPFRTDSAGCTRDPKSYLRASAGVLGLLTGAWVTSATTRPITSTSVLSQEVWFYTGTAGGQIMGFGDKQQSGGLLDAGLSTNTALQVFVTSVGRIDFATSTSTTAKYELLSPAGKSYADGNWHHVVAVYNGGTKQLYLDGQLVASASQSPSRSLTGYWRLGFDTLASWSNPSLSNNFEGGLQWAALYGTALTPAQVYAHYRAGVG